MVYLIIRLMFFRIKSYTDLTRTIGILVFEIGNTGGFTTIVIVTFQYTFTKRLAVRWQTRIKIIIVSSILKFIIYQNYLNKLILTLQELQIGFLQPEQPSTQSVWHGQAEYWGLIYRVFTTLYRYKELLTSRASNGVTVAVHRTIGITTTVWNALQILIITFSSTYQTQVIIT